MDLSNNVPSGTKLLLHVVDVGHGLTIVLQFRDQSGKRNCCYLYDAGYQKKKTHIYKENFLQSLSILPCYEDTSKDMKFSGIVISHPHADHYCGLKDLLESNNYHIAPTKLLVNTQFNPSKLLPHAQCEELNIDLPHSNSDNCDVEGLLCSCFKVAYYNSITPVMYSLKESRTKADETNNKAIKNDPNKHCLMMHVKLPKFPEVFLTGDAPYDRFEGGSLMSVFQVPHHGSKTRLPKQIVDHGIPSHAFIRSAALLLALYHNCDLLSVDIPASDIRAKSFIHYFWLNKSKIDKGLVNLFLSRKQAANINDPEGCYSVNNPQLMWYNDPNNKALFRETTKFKIKQDQAYWVGRLKSLAQGIAWAYIYKHIQAELYVVSAGDRYSLPAPEVLIGIIIACKWNGRRCRIVLTNNCKLDAFIKSFPKSVQEFAAANTDIWYLNDVNSEYKRPFFTIDPFYQSCNSYDYHNLPFITMDATDLRAVQAHHFYMLDIAHLVYPESIQYAISTRDSCRLVRGEESNSRNPPENTGNPSNTSSAGNLSDPENPVKHPKYEHLDSIDGNESNDPIDPPKHSCKYESIKSEDPIEHIDSSKFSEEAVKSKNPIDPLKYSCTRIDGNESIKPKESAKQCKHMINESVKPKKSIRHRAPNKQKEFIKCKESIKDRESVKSKEPAKQTKSIKHNGSVMPKEPHKHWDSIKRNESTKHRKSTSSKNLRDPSHTKNVSNTRNPSTTSSTGNPSNTGNPANIKKHCQNGSKLNTAHCKRQYSTSTDHTTSTSTLSHCHQGHHSAAVPYSRSMIYLEPYLQSIGNDVAPQNGHFVETVLECVLGSSVICQIKRSIQLELDEPDNDTVLCFSALDHFLRCKARGLSTFKMNYTDTAAVSATIMVYLPVPIVINDKAIVGAELEIANAKTQKLKFVLHLKFKSNEQFIPYNLSKHINTYGSCGDTLAEYVSQFDSPATLRSAEAWVLVPKFTLGETLHFLLGEQKAMFIFQELPACLVMQISQCGIRHHLTIVRFSDDKEFEEGHIHICLPNKSLKISLTGQVEVCITQLVLHIYPLHNIFEQAIQLKGEGHILGEPIEMSTHRSSIVPYNLEITFINRFTPAGIIELLSIPKTSLHLINQREIKLNEEFLYSVKVTASQLFSCCKMMELSGVYFSIIDYEDIYSLPNIPPQLTSFNISMCQASVAIRHPISAVPHYGNVLSAVLDIQKARLDCTLCAYVDNGLCDITFKYFFKPFDQQQNVHCDTAFGIVDHICVSYGFKVSEDVVNMPIMKQVMPTVVLKKLRLILSHNTVISVEFDVFIPKIEIYSKPYLILHDACARIVYTDDTFDLQFKGRLCLELEVDGKVHKYSYSAQLISPTQKSSGILSIASNDDDLTLGEVFVAFGCMSEAVSSTGILSSALSLAVRKLEIEFSPLDSSQGLNIARVDLVVHLDKFDIGILNFTDIELMVRIIKDETTSKYEVSFQVDALICDCLYVKLNYNAESRLLSGTGALCLDSTMPAPEALKLFKIEQSQSYANLNMIAQERFMSIFQSAVENKPKSTAGLMNFLEVSVYIPRKNEKYYIENMYLQVKDVLTIRNCVLDTIQFQYSQTPVQFSGASSTARVVAIIRTLSNEQSMKMVFDVTQSAKKPTVLTAEVMPANGCKALTIKSIIEFVGSTTPPLPEVKLPPFFDIGLVYGKLSFNLSPLVVSSFDVAILIPAWSIFSDPALSVYDLRLRATWAQKEQPQLIFEKCTLSFNEWKLHINGKITPTMVLMNGSSSESMLSSADTLRYESLLQDYTPSTQTCPDIPQSINLPRMDIDSIVLQIQLQKNEKIFCLKGFISPSASWRFGFGSHEAVVDRVGGALEWTRTKIDNSYRAFIFGSLRFNSLTLDVSMMLGKNVDSVLLGTVSNVDFGHMAGTLTSPDGHSNYVSLAPKNIQDITPFEATLALNITKKQLFMSGSIARLGSCTLIVGYLNNQQNMGFASERKVGMGYVVMLSLNEGFKFSLLSESLAFIDDYVSVRCVNLLVSSVDLKQLSSVMAPFKQASINGTCIPDPFSVIPNISSNQLSSEGVNRGTSLYALLNVQACKRSQGSIGKLYELGDTGLERTDIIIRAFFGSDSTSSVLKLSAWIAEIWLFGKLEFSKILLEYEVKRYRDAATQHHFKLHGTVIFHLDMFSSSHHCIKFDGMLSITNSDVEFKASACQDLVKKPVGIDVSLKNLALELQYTFGTKTPEIIISGTLMISALELIGTIYLIGTSFKVFEIELKNDLHLSALFRCSGVEWSLAGSINITISDGQFYYATDDVALARKGKSYKAGFHLECTITLFSWDFIVSAHIPQHDKSQLTLSGRSKKKIDLGFAKLTGLGSHSHNGPELIYSNKTLTLLVGVELFQQPFFEGEISYFSNEKTFEGSICYPGKILWIERPSIKVRYSKRSGFQIVEFNIPLLDGLFSLFGAIAKYAYALYQILCGVGVSWGIDLNITTGDNPDKKKYLVKLILKGAITISICGLFSCKVIPLPDLPLRIVRDDNFSLSKLPEFILKCLWESAGDICMSLLEYLNPWELVKKMGKMIIDGVVCAAKAVAKTVVAVAKKAWNGFKRIFGFSAFLVDNESKSVLGYVYAGKNERKLCNIQSTVNNFGPFLIAHAMKETASEYHTAAKACNDAGEENCLELLDELKENTQKLDIQLKLAADDVLAIKHLKMDIEHDGIHIAWDVGNEEGQYYTEDKGDIEYHAKVIAVLVSSNNSLKIEEVYNGILDMEYNTTKGIEDDHTNVHVSQESIQDELPTQEHSEACKDHEFEGQSEHENEIHKCLSDEAINGVPIESPSLSKIFPLTTKTGALNLEEAVYISASITPTVTLTMRTPPPNQPMFIDSNMEAQDKIWMKQIKEEIISRGSKKEVTLHGGIGTTLNVLKPIVVADTTATAECIYLEQENYFVINGTISQVPAGNKCLIQVSDKTDSTIIIKHNISIPDEHGTIEFAIHLNEDQLPSDSMGPYIVSYLLLSEFSSSTMFAISDFQLSRCPSVVDVNCSASDDSETVTLSWKRAGKDESTDDMFKVILCGKLSKTTYKMSANDLESDKLNKNEKALFYETKIVIPTASDDTQTQSCSFNPRSLYKQNGIALSTGVTINCAVVTCSKSNAALPSLPVSTELIIVAAPLNVKLHRPDNKIPGLMFSWSYTIQAISYEIEFIEESKNAVKHSKAYQYGKDDKSALDDFSVDKLLDIADLKCICQTQASHYLQVYALGFGDVLHKSLVPTKAKEKLIMVPMQLTYNPHKDTIVVKFTSKPCLYPYSVTLFAVTDQEDDKHMFLCEQTVQMDSKCGVFMELKKFRNVLNNSCSFITALACSTNSDQVFHVSVIVNDLEYLPEPQYVTVQSEYQSSWNVNNVMVNWDCNTLRSQCYQFGLQSMNTESVIWCMETTESSALVDFSKLESSLPTTGSFQFRCYVKTISQDSNSAVSSNLVINNTLYQCVTTPSGGRFLYTGVTLQQLWQRHLWNSVSSDTMYHVPFKNTLMLFRNRRRFPWELFSSKISSKFWTKRTILTQGYIFGNGIYQYANDLLDADDCMKLLKDEKVVNIKLYSAKKEDKNFKEPEQWHSQVNLLLYIRYSVKSDLRGLNNEVKMNYHLKVFGHARGATKLSDGQDTLPKKNVVDKSMDAEEHTYNVSLATQDTVSRAEELANSSNAAGSSADSKVESTQATATLPRKNVIDKSINAEEYNVSLATQDAISHAEELANSSNAAGSSADNQDTLPKKNVIDKSIDAEKHVSLATQDTISHTEEELANSSNAVGTESDAPFPIEESEQRSEGFFKKGFTKITSAAIKVANVASNVASTVASTVAALRAPEKSLYHEKTLKKPHKFYVSSDEQTITKSVAYVVKLNIKKCDKASLSLLLKNCTLEEVHLFETFV